eukprot:GHRR01019896.1.p1 GENE.GHRR01019896.1~~GHRR01019896.1.p1  ORF type:complete len:192 (+),score=45.65 GHRR01019896.1:171-746(+)
MEMPTKLRILTSHNPPVIIAENDNVNSTTGFLVDLLPHLLREADLTGVPYSFRLWNSSSGGRLQSNGSWSGVMGQLARHDVDFALFPLTLTQQRSQYMDYTPAYFDDGYGILVKKQDNTMVSLTFLQPYTLHAWLVILGALLVTVVIMYCLDKLTRRTKRRAHEDLLIDKQLATSTFQRHLYNTMLNLVQW